MTFVYFGSFSDHLTIWEISSQRTLKFIQSINIASPSWLSIVTMPQITEEYPTNEASSRYILLTTNEVDNFNGKTEGAVSSYLVDSDTGKLTWLSTVSSKGAHPTHIHARQSADKLSHVIYVSNYTSGSVSVHRMGLDGVIQEAVQLIDLSTIHSTDSYKAIGVKTLPNDEIINAHAHQVLSSLDHKLATVIDLGRDEVLQFLVDDSDIIEMNSQHEYTLSRVVPFQKDSGPRHIAFHPSEPIAFVLCEKSSTLVCLQYNRITGTLSSFQEEHHISTLQDGETNIDMAAGEIAVSDNGQYVYVSNRDNSEPDRGRSSMAVFKLLDPSTSDLRLVQIVSIHGKHPRYFTIINENTLLVVNKDSNNVVIYSIDPSTGMIDEMSAVETTHEELAVPTFALLFNK